jgi:hypothetical protein
MIMAKPPDGSSCWFHHSDVYALCNPDGRAWICLTVPVSGGRLDVIVPYVDNPYSLSYAMSLSADANGRIACDFQHTNVGTATPVYWTAETPPERLLPRERRVRARTSCAIAQTEGPVVAEVHAAKGGRIWFTDGDGRVRLEIRLYREGEPPPAGMKLLTAMTLGGRPVVEAFALDGKEYPVMSSETSLP